MLLPVPLADAVPSVAAVRIDQVKALLSISVAFSVRAKAVGVPSSDMLTLTLSPSAMTGASLTPSTVMVHDWVAGTAPFSPPSATCTATSALLMPFAGVHVTRPVAEMFMPLGACVSEKERSVPLLASSGSLTASW